MLTTFMLITELFNNNSIYKRKDVPVFTSFRLIMYLDRTVR